MFTAFVLTSFHNQQHKGMIWNIVQREKLKYRLNIYMYVFEINTMVCSCTDKTKVKVFVFFVSSDIPQSLCCREDKRSFLPFSLQWLQSRSGALYRSETKTFVFGSRWTGLAWALGSNFFSRVFWVFSKATSSQQKILVNGILRNRKSPKNVCHFLFLLFIALVFWNIAVK